MFNKQSAQQGFSMLGLMAVVAIIAVLAMVSMPIYNHYIEKSKVANAIPAIGNYKNAVANCFMEHDTLKVCNAGESGVPEQLTHQGRVLSLDVFEGNIIVEIDAQNHYTNTTPVKLAYVTNPDTDPTDASLDWNLLCNDYTGEGDRLLDKCVGTTEGEPIPDDGNNDSDGLVWEPTSPSFTEWADTTQTNFSAWQPPVNNQTSDFEQTRTFEQNQERERIVQQRNRLNGTVREVSRVIETNTITKTEKRIVNVDVQTGNSNSNYSDVGGLYDCNNWKPKRNTAFVDEQVEQTRECSQDQEKIIEYTAEGSVISTLRQDRTLTNVVDEREISGTEPLYVDLSDVVGDWEWTEPRNYIGVWQEVADDQTSGFTQTRDYERERRRLITEREKNQRTGEISEDSYYKYDTVNDTASRDVSVSAGAWSDVGAPHNCKNWRPRRNTIPEGQQFKQESDDCDQDRQRTWTYEVAGKNTPIHTRVEPDTYTVSDVQYVEGTKETDTSGATCKFFPTSNVSYRENQDNYLFDWSADPVGVVDGDANTVEVIKNGYRYFRGNPEGNNEWEICRESSSGGGSGGAQNDTTQPKFTSIDPNYARTDNDLLRGNDETITVSVSDDVELSQILLNVDACTRTDDNGDPKPFSYASPSSASVSGTSATREFTLEAYNDDCNSDFELVVIDAAGNQTSETRVWFNEDDRYDWGED